MHDTHQGLVSNDVFVGKLIYRYLFPSIIALLGMQSSGFINSVIIGNRLGSAGLSVVSLVMPIVLVYYSIGSLIGVGASIISGAALGRGDKDLCAKVYTLSYIVGVGIGVLMTVLGLFNLDQIVTLLGADPDKFDRTRNYVRFFIAGGSSWLLLYIPLNYLRVTGKPKPAMNMLLLLSFLNVSGCVIFVMLLDMGISGMALASVTSATFTFVFGAICLRDKNSPLKLQNPDRAITQIGSIVAAGSPSALNNVCRAVQVLSMNILIVRMGAGIFLPSYSLVSAVSDFLLAFTLGISQPMLPLVGISFGEKDFRSIRIILKKSLILGNGIIGICALVVLFGSKKIGLIFGLQDGDIFQNAACGLLFFACSINLAFINNLIFNFFNATHRVALANMIVVSRLVLFMVIPAWLLFPFTGINAVWISIVFTEAATIGVTFLVTSILHTKNHRLSRFLLLDSTLLENSPVIDFSVKNTVEDVDTASSKISGFCEENELSPKKAIHISLAIEEMLIMVNEYSLRKDKIEYTDVRIMITGERIIMRIRASGKHFNPVEYYYENKDTEAGASQTLGIGMILKMAQSVEYEETFGVNNLIIAI
ncbi:MAG: ATP-binding protein [Treponema sp.]|jgi:Na+-driven multidrug efflux pump/anti-sigma regulatory factor (Ser/Thr protein kinase)|nr:ATP-binding protein [Treponema sp.]